MFLREWAVCLLLLLLLLLLVDIVVRHGMSVYLCAFWILVTDKRASESRFSALACRETIFLLLKCYFQYHTHIQWDHLLSGSRHSTFHTDSNGSETQPNKTTHFQRRKWPKLPGSRQLAQQSLSDVLHSARAHTHNLCWFVCAFRYRFNLMLSISRSIRPIFNGCFICECVFHLRAFHFWVTFQCNSMKHLSGCLYSNFLFCWTIFSSDLRFFFAWWHFIVGHKLRSPFHV